MPKIFCKKKEINLRFTEKLCTTTICKLTFNTNKEEIREFDSYYPVIKLYERIFLILPLK